MEKSFNVSLMPPLVRDFASYKLTIQVCSKKTVDEYLSDLRLFLKYIYAKRNGITIALPFILLDWALGPE